MSWVWWIKYFSKTYRDGLILILSFAHNRNRNIVGGGGRGGDMKLQVYLK